ncbi:MAG: hypothetical protein A2445_02160 [Candidatus Jacksonbacteria bacterium RIFOXYC2_FULL_44_29]|nr:MAG: hypothetical protein A2295_05550 [Candidatus Jacksonbacteria bacterium RIFOXYB2_FULL_44_15]OGY78401.1 MAG: hypothetical protein A2550_06520 [Candidatus Jacksonbacteria bacterium RIFOXYD2_FULL_43_21]OGY81107.1 MAG: hypothetical protein A2445_02160 [Candidatus Jacksonbacteria bacterium RIFOXYC2_FULL_44_29]HBH46585.1 hypothetical protein [Candidatus Jacksonbacteria bacterium]HCC50579.1 hypothetical protein [Candidatus Jacksonbacteria bacterium]
MKKRLAKILFNTVLLVLFGIGILFIFCPFLLYWWIHADYYRYLWIIDGPFPYSHLGSAPFQLVLYGGLFLTGILIFIIAFILRKRRPK